MARSFDQVYSELGNAYDPSVSLYQQQIDSIPGQADALIAQTDAKKDQAFTDIVDSARRRGVGFWGIPSAEQAKYASTDYAPAIANIKSNAQNNKLSLLESVNSLNRDRRTQAQGIYDNGISQDMQERQFQESIRQFNEQLSASRAASASSDISKYLGTTGATGGTQTTTAPTQGSYGYKNGKNGAGGFVFVDGGNNPISASKYAQLNGINLLDLVNKMAKAGDTGASSVLKGPGVDTNSLNYKRYFAWDQQPARSGGGGGW